MERNIIAVLLFNFLIAAAVVVAAAAITAFIVANVILGWFQRAEGKHQRGSISLR
jgi:hypothetical protein